jgi:hypothetical protein
MRDLEVGDPDRASAAVAVEVLEGPPGRDEVAVEQRGQWPVDEEQIDVIRAQVGQRGVKGAARIVGPVPGIAQLARDEDLVASQARRSHGLPDASLVAVHLGGIDVPVAGQQGRSDHLGSVTGWHLVHAEPELWDRAAVIQPKVRNRGHRQPQHDGGPPRFVGDRQLQDGSMRLHLGSRRRRKEDPR